MIFELSEIKRIIKSNTSKNNYTKRTYIKICDDELFRLNELVGSVVTEVNETALSINKCVEYLKENMDKVSDSEFNELYTAWYFKKHPNTKE